MHLAQGAMFMTEQGAGSDVGATAVSRRAAAGRHLGAHGRQVVLLQPRRGAWRWYWPGPWAPRTAYAASACSCCPTPCRTGGSTRRASCGLKDKLGTRSMASGEVRLEGAVAWLVGDPGAGFRQMADMVNNSRLSNGVRAAGLMRRAVTEAAFVARRRVAFGVPTRRHAAHAAPAHEDAGVGGAGAQHDVPGRRRAAPVRCRGGGRLRPAADAHAAC